MPDQAGKATAAAAEASPGPRHEEYQYLDLVREILSKGEHRPDRTGTGTYSIFAPPPLRFSLRNNTFPLLTTKRVYTRAIIHELLWFLSGSTSSTPLSNLGIKIWDLNGSREYLDSIGLSHREVGDLGPVYGFQWRHFGAEYVDCHTDYTGQGVDQILDVVEKIKNKPFDRRIVLSAWNPKDLGKMALPPCHMFAQFYVSFPRGKDGSSSNSGTEEEGGGGGRGGGEREQRGKGELNCQLYQRSCDMGLGVPFNIASYALLTKMIAHVCGLEPGTFIHTMGDAHVYVDHVEALKVQLERVPRPFPKCLIKRDVVGAGGIDGFLFEDFEIVDYDPYPGIKMNMSV